MTFCLVLVHFHLAGALHSHLLVLLPSLYPDVGLAAHPTLPSQPYGRAGPGLRCVVLDQLNRSVVSGLGAVVGGAVHVNATHI